MKTKAGYPPEASQADFDLGWIGLVTVFPLVEHLEVAEAYSTPKLL